MQINLNVKVKAGPRTETEVSVYGTSVNEKTIKLKNGQLITETQIAFWIESELKRAIKKAGGEI